MSVFQAAFSAAYNLMAIEFTLYGFSMSFWKIMLWGAVASVVLLLIVRFLKSE